MLSLALDNLAILLEPLRHLEEVFTLLPRVSSSLGLRHGNQTSPHPSLSQVWVLAPKISLLCFEARFVYVA